ncbi:MAG: cellulase family glycosylhydrolase [Pirellulaceae bacterium]
MVRIILVAVLLLSGSWQPRQARASSPWPVAARPVRVDPQGVLRWQDTGEEVALFGVNYYTPFWHNYPDLQELGADHKQVIDQDVLHFARMGLNALRLHVFDREVSDDTGNVLANEHLDLLDYLIARAKERGIYTVLTPIAWWPVPGDSPGFSTRFTMHQMTTDPAARPPQINYLQQFLRHVNPYTGLAYKDDPAVVCLELINEPQYPDNTSDTQVVNYINALADAVRGTGCGKPIFYNGWGKRLAAVQQARVDGSSFGWYPSGLVAGHSLRRNFLPVVNTYGGANEWNPSMRTEELANKAKIIYEFDAADIPGSYIYPAMARAFRAGGAQIATQFQYDPLPLARYNQGWQTHFLSLVCAPQKAVSFIIAGEAFRRLPRLQDYGPYPASSRFGPCRVSYEEDLSEWVTPHEFFYSNSTSTNPPAPPTIERVIGCGNSPLVTYPGSGAYFLEKLVTGAWRLEVYPDAVWIEDPYGPHSFAREVTRILWREWSMEIHLDDLGDGFSVRALNAGNDLQTTAQAGRITIRPGVYLLQRQDVVTDAWQDAPLPVNVQFAEFVGLPETSTSWVVRHEPPVRWRSGQDLPVRFTMVGATQPVRVELVTWPGEDSSERRIDLQRDHGYQYAGTVPGDWLVAGDLTYALDVHAGEKVRRFSASGQDTGRADADRHGWLVKILSPQAPAVIFDAEHDRVQPWGSDPFKQRTVPVTESGQKALQISVEKFKPFPSAVSFRHEVDDELDPWRDVLADRTTLQIRARALESSTTAVEIVLLERDGAAWGTNVPLTGEWQDIRVPLRSLSYFAHWADTPKSRGGPGDTFQPAELVAVSACFGAWLYPEHFAEPHTIEIECIVVE